MKKTVSIIILAALLLLTLTACGKNVGGESESESLETEDKTVDINDTPSAEENGTNEDENNTTELFPFDDVCISVPYYEVITEDWASFKFEYSNFVYDDKGRLIQKECRGDDSYIIDYVYDENGLLLESTETSTYYSSKGDQDIYTYSYDEYGNVLTCTEKDIKADGSAGLRDGNHWEYQNEYDDNGNLIKTTHTNTTADYPNESILEYTYDDSGRVAEHREINYRDNEKKSEYVITPTYDEYGNKVKEVVKNVIDGDSWAHTWEYSEVGSKEYSISSGYLLPSNEWVTFKEVLGLPMPNSCIKSIETAQIEETRYTFDLPEEKEDAEIAYHIYSAILKDYCGYTLMTDESGKTFISKDGIALATMTADFKDAHCVVVTFN